MLIISRNKDVTHQLQVDGPRQWDIWTDNSRSDKTDTNGATSRIAQTLTSFECKSRCDTHEVCNKSVLCSSSELHLHYFCHQITLFKWTSQTTYLQEFSIKSSSEKHHYFPDIFPGLLQSNTLNKVTMQRVWHKMPLFDRFELIYYHRTSSTTLRYLLWKEKM